MFEPGQLPGSEASDLDQIYRQAPAGAFLVAGTATALVFVLWFLFYLLVFLPRGFLS